MIYAVISYVVAVALWVVWALATASRERRLRGE
jgi:hypothetical protein